MFYRPANIHLTALLFLGYRKVYLISLIVKIIVIVAKQAQTGIDNFISIQDAAVFNVVDACFFLESV